MVTRARIIAKTITREIRAMLNDVSSKSYSYSKAEKLTTKVLQKALKNKFYRSKTAIMSRDILAILVSERVKLKYSIGELKNILERYSRRLNRIVERERADDLAIALAYIKVKRLLR